MEHNRKKTYYLKKEEDRNRGIQDRIRITKSGSLKPKNVTGN